MKVVELSIPGVKLVTPDYHRDARGYFVETYNAARYREAGVDAEFVQDNESRSQKGVLRGMHWQTGASSQAKLVRVLKGAVYDVVVDLREGSPTYGRHLGERLTAAEGMQMFVPRGFAHGFLVLEDDTVFSYKCDNFYDRAAERGMRYDDPDLAIDWPDVGVPHILSEKDLAHPAFRDVTPERVR